MLLHVCALLHFDFMCVYMYDSRCLNTLKIRTSEHLLIKQSIELNCAHLALGMTFGIVMARSRRRFLNLLQLHRDKCYCSTMSAVKSIICLEAEMEIQRPQMPLNISGGLLMICCSNSKHEISSVSLKDFDMFHLFIIYLLLLFFCSTELRFINCFLSSTSLHLHSNIFFIR